MKPQQFWPAMRNSPEVSFEDGKWDGSKRAVEHVMLTEEALEHAPQWVVDEYGDEIDTGIVTNPIDRAVQLNDLGDTRCTVEAKVVSRDMFEVSEGTGLSLIVSDGTAEIDLVEFTNIYDDDTPDAETDGVFVGDTIEIKRAKPGRDKEGSARILVDRHTSVELVERGSDSSEQEQHDVQEQRCEAVQAVRVEAVRNTVQEIDEEGEHKAGAPIPLVVD
jgi:hypothetical protein